MSKTISIHKRRERIKHLGEQLSFRELTTEDKEFLSDALIQIGNGEDPATALDVGGRRGESNKEKARQAAERKEFAKIVMREHVKAGRKLTEIISEYGEHRLNIFGLTEETLKTYYQDED
jgi:proline dehydrogenase